MHSPEPTLDTHTGINSDTHKRRYKNRQRQTQKKYRHKQTKDFTKLVDLQFYKKFCRWADIIKFSDSTEIHELTLHVNVILDSSVFETVFL